MIIPCVMKKTGFSWAIILLLSCEVSAQSNFELIFGSAARYQDVVVREVISTNTIILNQGERVRLIGLKAPAAPDEREEIERDKFGFVVRKEGEPAIPLEEKALAFAKALLEGKRVRLEFDSERKDDDYTTLAYVFLLKDDTFVNTEILRQGFADLAIRPPNTKYAQQLRSAYREAREEKRGLQGE